MKKAVGKRAESQKKAYKSPELSRFGGITNLTQSQQRSNASDHGNNLMAPASA